MQKTLISLMLAWSSVSFTLEKEVDLEWKTQAQKVNEEAVNWLKDHLKDRLKSGDFLKNPLVSDSSNCKTCVSQSRAFEEKAPIYVFMSFSLEDRLWLQFSKELEQIGGIFVVRGLPNNSFKEFANRVYELQVKGVTVPIQIHPKLFREYDIRLVPAIVIAGEKKYDKITGNLSLYYALEKMNFQGETEQAKELYQKLKTLRGRS